MEIQEMVDYLNSRKCPDLLFYKLEELTDQDNIEDAIDCIQKHFNCNKETAGHAFVEYKKQIYSELKRIDNESIASLTSEQIAHNNAVAKELLNKPKCPTCSSTNIKKVSGTSKVISVAMFGLLSQKVKKTFHCNNCGYEW